VRDNYDATAAQPAGLVRSVLDNLATVRKLADQMEAELRAGPISDCTAGDLLVMTGKARTALAWCAERLRP
jgi:hypothetical protein